MMSKPALEVLFPNRKIKTRSQQITEKNSPVDIPGERSPMNSPPAFALRTITSRVITDGSKTANILPKQPSPLPTPSAGFLEGRRRSGSPAPLRTQAIMKAIRGGGGVKTEDRSGRPTDQAASEGSQPKRTLLELLRAVGNQASEKDDSKEETRKYNQPVISDTAGQRDDSFELIQASAAFLHTTPVKLEKEFDSIRSQTQGPQPILTNPSPIIPEVELSSSQKMTSGAKLESSLPSSPTKVPPRNSMTPETKKEQVPYASPIKEHPRPVAYPPANNMTAGTGFNSLPWRVNYSNLAVSVMQGSNIKKEDPVVSLGQNEMNSTKVIDESANEREKIVPGERIVYINDALSGLHGPRMKAIAQELYRCRRSVYENNKRKLDDSALHDYLEQKADDYMKWQYQNKYSALEANVPIIGSKISPQLAFEKTSQARPSMQEAIASLRKVNMNIARSHNKYASYYETPAILGKRVPLISDSFGGL